MDFLQQEDILHGGLVEMTALHLQGCIRLNSKQTQLINQTTKKTRIPIVQIEPMLYIKFPY